MPTVSVPRRVFYELYGEELSDEQFEELCFEFGIELDDVTTEKAIIRKEKHLSEDADGDEEIIYKIEVPANRYDLLCGEGIARALRVFKGTGKVPKFAVTPAQTTMTVKPETATVRPHVVCAVLRGVTFDTAAYNSFIDLQEKLHQNICRKRTLVAIGTHDLDTLEGPFTYEALPPEDIRFVPLKQTKEFNAKDLLEFYKSDSKFKQYVPIIESSPVYPVIYDSKRRVVSLPPIINGAHSAISLNTKDVFIECTATDLTKANIVLNTMVTMFSESCRNEFNVEAVHVIYDHGKFTYPDLSIRTMEVDVSYIEKATGIKAGADKIADLLSRMQLTAEPIGNGDKVRVLVPPTRSDILHACDVMEDVAIAYGYNNIPAAMPKSHTVGKPQPLNEFSDALRQELAMAGFTEVLNWLLVSRSENGTMLNQCHDENSVVVVANPRSSEFEVLRTSLLSGILKVMKQNKDFPRPVKIFEVSDIVRLDHSKDVGATNRRHLAALYSNTTSGFEIIHGLLDTLMVKLGVSDYHLQRSEEPVYLEGRQAAVHFKDIFVGNLGIIHPKVLKNFDIPDPCSYLELDVEYFL